ncbi:hypothetical protein LY76DRAFT_404095 [Colletotrichum caudatum]|nr:hypothetical protein LY76DRAFT_404095 [Colletotrichum caudatum]
MPRSHQRSSTFPSDDRQAYGMFPTHGRLQQRIISAFQNVYIFEYHHDPMLHHRWESLKGGGGGCLGVPTHTARDPCYRGCRPWHNNTWAVVVSNLTTGRSPHLSFHSSGPRRAIRTLQIHWREVTPPREGRKFTTTNLSGGISGNQRRL